MGNVSTLTPRDWLKWECDQGAFGYCRKGVTVLAGSGSDRILQGGMVVGAITKGSATATAKAGNTGNGTVGAITVGAAAKPGKYKVTFIEPATNLGAFTVTDPDGIELKAGTVGSAYSDGGLGFTIADGATDFVSGDQFDLDVAVGSGKVVQIDSAGTDGREDAFGILLTSGVDDVTAPNGSDAKGVVVYRGPCVVSDKGLIWPAGFTTNQKAAAVVQLEASGIRVAAGN